MNAENALALSTAALDYQYRDYLNAEHAARRYVGIKHMLESVPGIDPGRPLVDCSSIADAVSAKLVDEKRALEVAFLAASEYRRITRDKFMVWCHIRIGELPYSAVNVCAKSTAHRWVGFVDRYVDLCLDDLGLLASSEVLHSAYQHGAL